MFKLIKKMSSNHLVLAISAVVLLYAFYNYSNNKSMLRAGLQNNGGPQGSGACGSNYESGTNSLAGNSGPASFSGQTSGGGALPQPCAKQETIDPKDLLPNDANSKFAQMNPRGDGDLMGSAFLEAGHHIGINTVGQSLRNANLQLRSEPPNPQHNTGPWSNTTIGPDLNRRPLEIGCN